MFGNISSFYDKNKIYPHTTHDVPNMYTKILGNVIETITRVIILVKCPLFFIFDRDNSLYRLLLHRLVLLSLTQTAISVTDHKSGHGTGRTIRVRRRS